MKDIYLVSTVRVSVSDNAPDKLEQMLAYISQHCDDATLTSVAAYFRVHPNTVSGMIKRETGKTFGEVVREMRMSRALTLLNSGKISIAQISRLCGYDNPSNFYRVFKQSFGMTPRAYMAQHGGSNDSVTITEAVGRAPSGGGAGEGAGGNDAAGPADGVADDGGDAGGPTGTGAR
jgi:AraC-like DNA-binding protein